MVSICRIACVQCASVGALRRLPAPGQEGSKFLQAEHRWISASDANPIRREHASGSNHNAAMPDWEMIFDLFRFYFMIILTSNYRAANSFEYARHKATLRTCTFHPIFVPNTKSLCRMIFDTSDERQIGAPWVIHYSNHC